MSFSIIAIVPAQRITSFWLKVLLITCTFCLACNHAALAKEFRVRVGISTKSAPLQLWSKSRLIITDKNQPKRKMLVDSKADIRITKTAPAQLKAKGATFSGTVQIRINDTDFPAWQVVNIRPLNWRYRIRLSSNGDNPQWSRPYRGTFEITTQTYSFDPARHQNPLRVVNEVTMQDYLKGVVPWEMKPTAPLEALKAQAICARSETLSNIKTGKHRKDGFFVCDYDHCQGYPGAENEKPRSTLAVKQTKGLILTYQGHIADAVYGTNSGGITAASTDVWRGPNVPYLQSVDDFPKDSATAKVVKKQMTEKDWAKYCTTDLPSFAQPTPTDRGRLASRRAKYPRVARLYRPGDLPNFYRWKRTFTQAELLKALAPKMQPPVNFISDFQVIRRADSGHIKVLRVFGQWLAGGTVRSTSFIDFKGDGSIRSMLSGRLGSIVSLPSSTFVITPQLDADKKPTAFVLHGAGWGHGVGMDQTGAMAHARQGWNARQILHWYFRGVTITTLDTLSWLPR